MTSEEGIAKAIGVACGTFLSLVFVPPKTIAGFIRRLVAAVIFGWIFGHIALSIMLSAFDLERNIENVTAAWATASFSSWTAMGLWRSVIQRRAERL